MSVQTSVIIPVYNDPDGLRTTLDSLVDQTADAYEVIVIDNNSSDETPLVADEYASRYEFVEWFAENEIQSSYAARNLGIAHSIGEVIGFLDADVRVDQSYVKSITQSILTNGWQYMGCNIDVVVERQESCVRRYNKATGFPVDEYIRNDNFAPTACLVVHRNVIDDVGDFDDTLISGGDLEFGQRVASHGVKQIFNQEISVYHPARSTIREVFKKELRVGRGLEQLAQQYPDRFSRNRRFFHPQHYLPVHPLGFYDDLQDETEYPLEIVCWYVIAWVGGIFKTIGRIAQSTRDNR